ncbi:MAG: hypothetical protein ACRELB_27085 [Polyangiaceae bacterium]
MSTNTTVGGIVAIIAMVFAMWKELAPRARLKAKLDLLAQAKDLGVLDEPTLNEIKASLSADVWGLTLDHVKPAPSAAPVDVRRWVREMAAALWLAAFFNVLLVAHFLGRQWRDELGTAVVVEAFCGFILLISARDAWRLRKAEAVRAVLMTKLAQRPADDQAASG